MLYSFNKCLLNNYSVTDTIVVFIDSTVTRRENFCSDECLLWRCYIFKIVRENQHKIMSDSAKDYEKQKEILGDRG